VSAIDRLEAALAAHGCDPKRRGDHIDALCPTHDDVNPSLDVDPGRDGRALVTCRTGCQLDDILATLELSWGDLFDVDPSRNGKPEITAEYPYTDEQGNLLFQVVRYSSKSFRQRRPDGAGGWTWKLGNVRRVPYRLPELLAGVAADRWVLVAEGERDVDRLVREGFLATTNAGGAGKFLAEFATYFAGAKVAILRDNDGPGRAHARQVAASLVGSAEMVKVIELPGLPEHGDVSDWLDAGRTAAELRQIIVEVPRWTRDEPAAEKVPVPTGCEDLEEVDSAELLDDVVAALLRYVVFRLDAQVVAIALWVLNTYLFERYDSTPYLLIRSATKQSGKSRLLEVLALLVNRPWSAVEATEAVLFRKIEASTPTLLLDEIDAAFGKDSTMTEGLRAVLNAGYRRGATVPRCVGPQYELRDFAVFCPKAFAGIGASLPDTVMDRAIPIELRRRAPHERQPARFHQASARAELTPLQDRIRAWATAAGERLTGAEPELPDALSDRQQDSWEPLSAVADLAGREWPERARAAAVELHAGVVDQDVGVLLLTHLRELFEEHDADALSTEEVLAALVNRGDDSPWPRWWGEDVERQQTKGPASQLARKLKPYGIKPEQLWLNGGKTRGYRRSDFEDSWGRYLPPLTSTTTHLPQQDGRTVDLRSEAVA
jgi:hypothetical protein